MQAWRWPLLALVLLLAGGLLRGVAVPAGRADVAPAGRFGQIRWPWAPAATVTVWFPDDTGRHLVPVARRVAAATVRAALAELAAGPVPGRGLAPALPAGTALTAAAAAPDGHAGADLAGGAALTELQREALVRTLGALPGATAVRVTHNGQVLFSGPPPVPAPGDLTVYYLHRGLPLPVTRPAPAGTDPYVAAVNAVLHGAPPPDVDWLPAGVELESLAVKGGTAHVRLRFSPALAARVEAGAWNFAPYYMALVYTLTEFPEIKKAQFDFTGLTAVALKQCRTPLAVPLLRPEPEPGRWRAGA